MPQDMVLQHFPIDYIAVINESDWYQIEFQQITVFILAPNGDRQKHAPERIIFFKTGQPFLINRAYKLMGVSSTPPAAMFYLYPKFSVISLILETVFW